MTKQEQVETLWADLEYWRSVLQAYQEEETETPVGRTSWPTPVDRVEQAIRNLRTKLTLLRWQTKGRRPRLPTPEVVGPSMSIPDGYEVKMQPYWLLVDTPAETTLFGCGLGWLVFDDAGNPARCFYLANTRQAPEGGLYVLFSYPHAIAYYKDFLPWDRAQPA